MSDYQDEIINITRDMVESYVDRYCQKIKILDGDCDFELNSSVRDTAANSHIMYKLRNKGGCLWLEGRGGRRYEFLIEFDTKDFAYGIYFGCKCILDDNNDTLFQVKACKEEWRHIRPEVIRALNNTFIDLDFSERDIPTDNVNDNTYWPFWYRLGEEESVDGVAALATKIIRNVYQEFFEEDNYNKIMSGDVPENERAQECKAIGTRYTRRAYDEVLKQLDDDIEDIYCADAKLYFETLIQVLEDKDVISPCRIYEKCWVLNDWHVSELEELIVAFNEIIRDKRKDRVSWGLFTPNFLAGNKKPIVNIRRQKNTSKISKKTRDQIDEEIIPEVKRRVKEENNKNH